MNTLVNWLIHCSGLSRSTGSLEQKAAPSDNNNISNTVINNNNNTTINSVL